MRVPIALAAVVLTANGLVGQEKPAEPKAELFYQGNQAVIIPVKTLSGDSFNRLAKMLEVFNVKYVADDKLRTILVYAPREIVAQIRRVVEELDRPGSEAAIGRNIDITLAFLRCSTKPLPSSIALPPDLEAAARQLRAATQYKHVELWDLVPLRMQEGRVTQQKLRLPGTTIPEASSIFATAEMDIFPEAVTMKEGSRYVRFQHVNIRFRIPYLTAPKSYNVTDVILNTAGDFKEGQKTILGKLSGLEDETATFVVISLKVID
jgi:hypothetical protein